MSSDGAAAPPLGGGISGLVQRTLGVLKERALDGRAHEGDAVLVDDLVQRLERTLLVLAHDLELHVVARQVGADRGGQAAQGRTNVEDDVDGLGLAAVGALGTFAAKDRPGPGVAQGGGRFGRGSSSRILGFSAAQRQLSHSGVRKRLWRDPGHRVLPLPHDKHVQQETLRLDPDRVDAAEQGQHGQLAQAARGPRGQRVVHVAEPARVKRVARVQVFRGPQRVAERVERDFKPIRLAALGEAALARRKLVARVDLHVKVARQHPVDVAVVQEKQRVERRELDRRHRVAARHVHVVVRRLEGRAAAPARGREPPVLGLEQRVADFVCQVGAPQVAAQAPARVQRVAALEQRRAASRRVRADLRRQRVGDGGKVLGQDGGVGAVAAAAADVGEPGPVPVGQRALPVVAQSNVGAHEGAFDVG